MNKSVLGKFWSHHFYDEDFISKLKTYLGINDFLAKLISVRVKTPQQAEHFLESVD